jgi:chaperonin GroES
MNTTTQFRPLGDKVLIQPEPAEEKSEGGIINPRPKVPNTGKILAVSPDYQFDVAVGDRILYNPTHRKELEDGTILLSEQHIELIYN